MNNFEATILISPEIAKTNLSTIVETVEKSIKENAGSIIAKEEWGLRELAYKINSLKKAFYFFYQIEIDGSKIEILKKNFSQNEKILRYLFIKVKEHEKLPTKIFSSEE
tara:strand:- start:51 stop:377 length:327 start_codon:yes stop_codon:yes gene_type:complete